MNKDTQTAIQEDLKTYLSSEWPIDKEELKQIKTIVSELEKAKRMLEGALTHTCRKQQVVYAVLGDKDKPGIVYPWSFWYTDNRNLCKRGWVFSLSNSTEIANPLSLEPTITHRQRLEEHLSWVSTDLELKSLALERMLWLQKHVPLAHKIEDQWVRNEYLATILAWDEDDLPRVIELAKQSIK